MRFLIFGAKLSPEKLSLAVKRYPLQIDGTWYINGARVRDPSLITRSPVAIFEPTPLLGVTPLRHWQRSHLYSNDNGKFGHYGVRNVSIGLNQTQFIMENRVYAVIRAESTPNTPPLGDFLESFGYIRGRQIGRDPRSHPPSIGMVNFIVDLDLYAIDGVVTREIPFSILTGGLDVVVMNKCSTPIADLPSLVAISSFAKLSLRVARAPCLEIAGSDWCQFSNQSYPSLRIVGDRWIIDTASRQFYPSLVSIGNDCSSFAYKPTLREAGWSSEEPKGVCVPYR